jgi:hypothetical protein
MKAREIDAMLSEDSAKTGESIDELCEAIPSGWRANANERHMVLLSRAATKSAH